LKDFAALKTIEVSSRQEEKNNSPKALKVHIVESDGFNNNSEGSTDDLSGSYV